MTTVTIGTAAPVKRPKGQWVVPTALILLTLIPIIAGAGRLAELTGGPAITPQNVRFVSSPIPVVIHIVTVTVYCLLGAFQFAPALRGRRGWHRIAGRILIPAGLLAALSGLWMAGFYSLPEGEGGNVLLVIRLVFGSAMVAAIVLAVRAILRRDFVRHGAWMTRGYALGVAAGTQAIVLAFWIILVGPTDEFTRALLLGASWVINLAVAELFIFRRTRKSARSGG